MDSDGLVGEEKFLLGIRHMLTPVLTSALWASDCILLLAGGALVCDKASLSAFAEVILLGE